MSWPTAAPLRRVHEIGAWCSARMDAAGDGNDSSGSRFVRMTAGMSSASAALSIQVTASACLSLSMRPARWCKPDLVCPSTYSNRVPEDAIFLI
eukprot:scaffold46757_cov69-Phaeocystis_antarctica.AAC.4